jgi:hypothetical protein
MTGSVGLSGRVLRLCLPILLLDGMPLEVVADGCLMGVMAISPDDMKLLVDGALQGIAPSPLADMACTFRNAVSKACITSSTSCIFLILSLTWL